MARQAAVEAVNRGLLRRYCHLLETSGTADTEAMRHRRWNESARAKRQ
jgi:hypothetical protein